MGLRFFRYDSSLRCISKISKVDLLLSQDFRGWFCRFFKISEPDMVKIFLNHLEPLSCFEQS